MKKTNGKKVKSWRKLDNAALLFSADNSKNDPRVFRFYSVLHEDISESLLQQALDQTMEIFPLFQSTMREGLFWLYLEHSDTKPIVRKEYKDPCLPIYDHDKKGLLFEVTYYKNRINLEIFHALTDGTGGSVFIKELVKNYLLLAHAKEKLPGDALWHPDIPMQEMESDSFSKYYTSKKTTKKKKIPAIQMRRIAAKNQKMNVHELTLPVSSLLAKTHELSVSISVFLTAILIYSLHKEVPKLHTKKPIRLMVPVNLRNFFESESMLNFFAWIEPEYTFDNNQEPDFYHVLDTIKKYYKEQLNKETMESHINTFTSLEKHPILKFFPISLKNAAIFIGSKKSASDITAIYSNMSVIKMPEEFTPYIERFGVYTSTPKLELTMCSFKDTITLSFTSKYNFDSVIHNFTKLLKENDLSPTPVEPEYPETDTPELKGLTIYKWFSFLCIISALTSIAINFSLYKTSLWSIIACAGIASFWASFSVAYYKRHNLLKVSMWQLVLITCASIIWDLAFGFKGWSLDYVFPGMSLLVLITMIIITRLQSHAAKEYMIYLLMAASYGFVIPFIFLLTGVVKSIYLSVISALVGLLLILILLVFKWKDVKEEMQKKFHV
ncbi:MAG TPA: hypothetical protein H9887_00175 [Candidatus Dorea intestinavium]|nr:hypothetical protein [Candidatus Dorea intestinavium]